MVGRRKKKPKSDAPQPQAQQAPKAGYRDWDTIIPGQPMAPQPYAETVQPWQQPQPQYQQPEPQVEQPVAPPPQPQPQYQQPQPQPQYQQPPAAQPTYQQPQSYVPNVAAGQPPPAAPAGSAAPAPAAAVNPTDGTCTKCGKAFGSSALCESCGIGRTACMVCGTKIWAGALTCAAHSNAGRR